MMSGDWVPRSPIYRERNARGRICLNLTRSKQGRALARSGYFYGLTPLEFELSFEEGFDEEREWLVLPSTKEELERLCEASRAKRKAA